VGRGAAGGSSEGADRGVVLVHLAEKVRFGGVNNDDLSFATANVILVALAENVSPIMSLHYDGVSTNLGGVEFDVAISGRKVGLALRVGFAVGVEKSEFYTVT